MEPISTDEKKREIVFFVQLVGLTQFYQREALLCFEAKALFAAGILIASALESVLLERCLLDKIKIIKSITWKSLNKTEGTSFVETLQQNRGVTLNTLLSLAKELEWFPTGPISNETTSKLIENLGENNRCYILEWLRDYPSGDELFQETSALARESRNYIHPAVCIREGIKIESKIGKRTFVFVMVVLSLLQVKIDQMYKAVTAKPLCEERL
jgi:hypothetical protein